MGKWPCQADYLECLCGCIKGRVRAQGKTEAGHVVLEAQERGGGRAVQAHTVLKVQKHVSPRECLDKTLMTQVNCTAYIKIMHG